MAAWNAHRSNSGPAVLSEENTAQNHNIRSNNSAETNENDEDENATEKTKVRGKSIITETLTDFAKLKKLFVSPVTILDEPVKDEHIHTQPIITSNSRPFSTWKIISMIHI